MPTVNNFADIIKIVAMFVKTTLKIIDQNRTYIHISGHNKSC